MTYFVSEGIRWQTLSVERQDGRHCKWRDKMADFVSGRIKWQTLSKEG